MTILLKSFRREAWESVLIDDLTTFEARGTDGLICEGTKEIHGEHAGDAFGEDTDKPHNKQDGDDRESWSWTRHLHR